MGQGTRHFQPCKALYEILRAAAGPGNTVACDAFVYFDAGDADRKLAPDGMVKLGVPQLRYARDAEGVDLIPTTEEVASAAQAAVAATEAQLRAEATARREAEDELREVKRRIAELESSKT
jgi:hypothetical protein